MSTGRSLPQDADRGVIKERGAGPQPHRLAAGQPGPGAADSRIKVPSIRGSSRSRPVAAAAPVHLGVDPGRRGRRTGRAGPGPRADRRAALGSRVGAPDRGAVPGMPRETPRAFGGAARQYTRADRTRATSTARRSRSSHASRVASYPASIATTISGSPSSQCPAAISWHTTSRSCAAVTEHRRHPGPAAPRPAAASSSTHPAPAPPRTSTATPAPPAPHSSPARAHGTAAAPDWSPRPDAARWTHPPPAGSARPATPQRQPRQRPPQPRDPDMTRVQRVIQRPVPPPEPRHQRQPRQIRHRPGAHSTASHTSNSASGRRVNDQYSSRRNPASTPSPSSPETRHRARPTPY